MSANLHQLELSYHPLEDRLLLKIYTTDLCEFRFWLTRKFTLALWNILMKILEADQKNSLQEEEKQKVTEHFEDEQARKQPTAQKLGTKMTRTPLGEEPILTCKVSATPMEKGKFSLSLEGPKGQHIELGTDSYILLSLCKLISETVKKTDWDLQLKFE